MRSGDRKIRAWFCLVGLLCEENFVFKNWEQEAKGNGRG